MDGPTRSLRITLPLALLAGLAICFAMPPWGWWPLALVGIALWAHLLDDRRARDRFFIGWAVGIGWFGPSTLWMWELTQPGYVVGVLLGWGPMVAVVALACPRDRRRLLVLPAAVIVFEWFHSHAPFGGVPLSMLAMTQTHTPLLFIARLGGALLLGGAVAALGVALYLAARREWRPAGAIVAGVALLALGGALWPLGDPVGTVRIAAVQGGGPQGTRYTAGEEPLVFDRHLQATRAIPANDDRTDKDRVDLVVWPENAVNVAGKFAEDPWRRELATQAARIGAPILVGAVEDAGDKSFNNFVQVLNPDGTLGTRFDKKRRVPFGEYVPMRAIMEPVAGSALPQRDAVPGNGVAVVQTPGGPMAVAISWEIFFGRRVREGVRAGGQVVLNPTNGSSYWLTEVQTQQLATSQLRAMESGRWVVQAAPTGFSGFFDPDGGIHQRTDVSEQKVVTRTIPRYDSTMPAQALGDVPALVVAGILLLVAFGAMRRRSPSTGAVTPPTGA